jgi:hypothetical protein
MDLPAGCHLSHFGEIGIHREGVAPSTWPTPRPRFSPFRRAQHGKNCVADTASSISALLTTGKLRIDSHQLR